jgi:hypothetical protein
MFHDNAVTLKQLLCSEGCLCSSSDSPTGTLGPNTTAHEHAHQTRYLTHRPEPRELPVIDYVRTATIG